MKLFFLLAGIFSLNCIGKDYVPDKKQAQEAFVYLNQIRTEPKKFVDKFSFLKDVQAMKALRWNDTLAKVAEGRAIDLAKRNYFAHVDPDGYAVNYYISKAGYLLEPAWTKEKNANFFESLNAGSIGAKDAIEKLLIDTNTASLGHRKHLLGLDQWNASLYDIGIGYVPGDEKTAYTSYTCVIIAKHSW